MKIEIIRGLEVLEIAVNKNGIINRIYLTIDECKHLRDELDIIIKSDTNE